MKVYRITPHKYANDLTGTGAAMYGGRWNKKGTPVLYTGENKEIALLETIVHTPPMLIPNLDILTLDIPNDSISKISLNSLPRNWKNYPAPTILSNIAEQWVQSEQTIALKVPSCIIHSSFIYVLNCRHPEYNRVKIESIKNFHFDSRLNS